MFVKTLFASVAILVTVSAYSEGPPDDVCEEPMPREPTGHRADYLPADRCPFMIIGFPWVPGTAKQVAIMTYQETDTRTKFNGFIATVTRDDIPIGTMIQPAEGNIVPITAKTKLMCDDQSIAHADNEPKSEVIFSWLPPADLPTDAVLQLRLTVVGDDNKENWVDCRLNEYNEFLSEENSNFQSTTPTTTASTATTTTTPEPTTTTPKPTTPKPTTPEPTTPEPTTPEPTTPEPTTPKPTTPKPTTPKPTTPEPTTPKPTTPEPTTPKPTTPEPTTTEPTTPEPRKPEPKTPEPKTPEPRTPEPRTPEPQTPEPQTPEPQTPEPKTPEPQTPEPVSLEPKAKPDIRKTPEVQSTSEKDAKPTGSGDSYLMYGARMGLKHDVMSPKMCEEGRVKYSIVRGTKCEKYEVDWGLTIKYQYKCPMGHKGHLKFDPRACACTGTNHCPVH